MKGVIDYLDVERRVGTCMGRMYELGSREQLARRNGRGIGRGLGRGRRKIDGGIREAHCQYWRLSLPRAPILESLAAR